jgi:hypothetical protein
MIATLSSGKCRVTLMTAWGSVETQTWRARPLRASTGSVGQRIATRRGWRNADREKRGHWIMTCLPCLVSGWDASQSTMTVVVKTAGHKSIPTIPTSGGIHQRPIADNGSSKQTYTTNIMRLTLCTIHSTSAQRTPRLAAQLRMELPHRSTPKIQSTSSMNKIVITMTGGTSPMSPLACSSSGLISHASRKLTWL